MDEQQRIEIQKMMNEVFQPTLSQSTKNEFKSTIMEVLDDAKRTVDKIFIFNMKVLCLLFLMFILTPAGFILFPAVAVFKFWLFSFVLLILWSFYWMGLAGTMKRYVRKVGADVAKKIAKEQGVDRGLIDHLWQEFDRYEGKNKPEENEN